MSIFKLRGVGSSISSFHSLAQHVYDSFQLVLTSQIVSEEWILRFVFETSLTLEVL